MGSYDTASTKWSGDVYFLNHINSLVQAYTLANYDDDLSVKFDTLVMLKTIITPVIKADFTKEMDWLTEKIYLIEVKNPNTGVTMSVNVPLKHMVKTYMQKVLEKMLVELEKEGIYTKKILDPRGAMGNFGGS